MLQNATIPSLHNGVSQQSAAVRSPEQAEAVENAILSLSDGTGKRPPTETIARLMTSSPTGAAIHLINRDVTERYVVVIAEGRIRVFDLQGVEQPVSAPAGWTYLEGATDYNQDINLTTVADYTFVVNRTRTCRMISDGEVSPGYTVWLNRSFGEDGDEVSYAPGAQYSYAPNPPDPGFLSGSMQSMSKLPEVVDQGSVWRVAGSEESGGFRTYYVRRNGGVWDEFFRPKLKNEVDMSSMPHALLRDWDGTFIFAPFSWAPRRVGDTNTNPNPVFIGRKIRKVFLFQNRLGFLCDENVVMSCASDLGNFWRTTVLDALDSDAMTLSAASTQVSVLNDAVVFNDGLLLTTDQTQFSLSNGEDGTSAVSVAIRPVTNYEVSPRSGLVSMGTEAYYATENDKYAAIREYTRIDGEDSVNASDVTAHCPAYIPSGVHRLIPLPDKSALLTLTDGDPSAVYVYQYYWLTATEKRQSAFHRWTFGEDSVVVSGGYVGGYLYLTIKRHDGLFLERVSLQSRLTAPNVDHEVFLDRRVTAQGVFNPATQTTVVSLPYSPDRTKVLAVRTRASGKQMSVVDPTTYRWNGANELLLDGDETAGPLLVGERYTMRYVFSPLFLKRNDGTSILTGRTQIRTFTVSYRDTGYFRTYVAPYGVDGMTEEILPGLLSQFTGKVLGQRDLIINSPAYHSGDYTFSVQGQAQVAQIALENDSHVGCHFVSAEWEAFHWSRARG